LAPRARGTHDILVRSPLATDFAPATLRAARHAIGARLRGMTPYADYKPLTFHDAARRFTDGNDNPRAYLERCLDTIAQREPVVKALTAINETGARAAADASAARWKAG
jgi:hypothetical protein